MPPILLEKLPGPPNVPGWYWFKGDTARWEMLFEVRLIDGELRMMKFYLDDVPVAETKGSWRGPLRLSSGTTLK